MAGPLVATSMQPQQVARPAFTIKPEQRTYRKKFAVKDANGFTTEEREVTVDGFMVTTRRGDSAFIESMDEIRRLGYDKLVPLLVDDKDEPVAFAESAFAPAKLNADDVQKLIDAAVAKALADRDTASSAKKEK